MKTLDARPDTGKGFDADYFRQLSEIEETSNWFRYRNSVILWMMKRYFPGVKTFLELGCGTGFVLSDIERSFPQLALSGGDIYGEGIAFASRRLKRAVLYRMDARSIPFQDEFDVIGAFDLLEHTDDELVLSEMYRAVHNGGGIIIAAPQHEFLWSQYDEAACHMRRYSRNALEGRVRKAGFTIIRTVSFMSLCFPLMVMSRLLRKRRNPAYDVMSDIRLGDLANNAIGVALNLESRLIRSGISLPFGGSLVMAARKVS